MATIYQFFNKAYHPKPRQDRFTDWRSHLISALAAACLLLALALIYRAHEALDALVPGQLMPVANAQDVSRLPPAPPARAYNPDDDVWPWLEPLPPTF